MNKEMEYIWVLDFTDGKVYRYDINTEWGWTPDNESCEDFLIEQGHKIQNCEWMLTNDGTYNDVVRGSIK
jgi:hypothetical protein